MEAKILIAEDEPRLREVVRDYFRSKGVQPVEAEHGAQALRLEGVPEDTRFTPPHHPIFA